MSTIHKILKNIFWWRKSLKDQGIEETKEYILGWNGILESEKDRRKMTSAMLAVRLSECEKNSPAYILFEHELNRRIAYVQAFPIYLSIVMTIVGLFLGWALSQWKPLEPTSSCDTIAAYFKKHNQACADNNTEYKSTEIMQPRPVSEKFSINSVTKPNAKRKTGQPKQQEKTSKTK